MSVLMPSPLPNPPREGSMEAILDGDVRRAPVAEQCLLNAPMTVSGGSKHDNIDIIFHSNDQPSIVPYYGYLLGLFQQRQCCGPGCRQRGSIRAFKMTGDLGNRDSMKDTRDSIIGD